MQGLSEHCGLEIARLFGAAEGVLFDQGEDELLENAIKYGRCRTCGTPVGFRREIGR